MQSSIMKSKTVLFFPALYPYYTGGMEVFNASLAKMLLKKPNVILLTTKNILVDSINEKSTLFQVKENLFIIKRWGLGYLSMLVSCLISRKIRVAEWSTLMIPYTSNFNYNAWPILFFSKIFGFRYSVHCHGGGIRGWQTPSLQKCFFKNANKRAAVSFRIIEEYNKRTGLHFDYLPPLMSFRKSNVSTTLMKKRLGIAANDKVLLYVGSLKPLKSPETLLIAFRKLNHKNVKLIISGDGILRKELEQKYASDNVIFLGVFPNEDIGDLYAISDIYVIPSWFEGTPISLLEAMSNKLCCIGSNVMGINNIIHNGVNGLLFPVDDVQQLSSALANVLDNDTLCEQLSENALKTFNEKFDYPRFVAKINSFLDI